MHLCLPSGATPTPTRLYRFSGFLGCHDLAVGIPENQKLNLTAGRQLDAESRNAFIHAGLDDTEIKNGMPKSHYIRITLLHPLPACPHRKKFVRSKMTRVKLTHLTPD